MKKMSSQEVSAFIDSIPDEVLQSLSFSAPWQYDVEEGDYHDADGAPILGRSDKDDGSYTRDKLQSECWIKFHRNPFVNSATRGMIGRMTGMGFGTYSDIWEIQEVIDEIELDQRNRLYNFWPKYLGKRLIEGELFLQLTCHKDGFIEVDLLDPSSFSNTGDDTSGIIFHSKKKTMPLFYILEDGGSVQRQLVPSIYIAYYPDLILDAKQHKDWKFSDTKGSKMPGVSAFRKFKGFYRFIVGYDSGFVTRRAVSYLRTILEWLNHYENLKKYEIDHKKASGAYLWVFTIEDAKAFKIWLKLSDEDKRKTGIGAKKTPGGTIVLPPGIKVECINPQLSTITDQDDDIKELISSGMNESSDVMTGRPTSTFASAKALKGPMSDRTSDEIAWFSRFLQYDFWGAVFFLRASLGKMKATYPVEIPIDFDKDGEIIKKTIQMKPERLIDFDWPISENVDYEERAKGLLGTKHGPLAEVLGIPQSNIARKMGFGAYKRLRLIHALEKEKYPELVYTADAEAIQEEELEPSRAKQKKTAKKKKEE